MITPAKVPSPSPSPAPAPSFSNRDTGRTGRINALLVALSTLLAASRPWNVSLLPHITPSSFSSPCPPLSDPLRRTPQHRFLDTLAALCAFHPSLSSASFGGVALALEAGPDGLVLYVAPQGKSPSAELRRDMELWIVRMRDVAEWERDQDAAEQEKQYSEADVMTHPEARLMTAVVRACYATVRARVQECSGGRLGKLLERLKESVVDGEDGDVGEGEVPAGPVITVEDIDAGVDDDMKMKKKEAEQEDCVEKLCMDLQLYMSCTEPEDVGSTKDEDTRMGALCVAGWLAVQHLKDKKVRRAVRDVGEFTFRLVCRQFIQN